MPTYRLDLAYLGTSFHGYARQAGLRTVQGELEGALARLVDFDRTSVAGRTDAGVHASGQVVSFTCEQQLDRERVLGSLNKMLGPEIAVSRVVEEAPGFDARFSATGRHYVYRILDAAVPDPFLAATSWHVAAPLDVDAMNEAAAWFRGEHDFASFCRRSGDSPSVRRVLWAGWGRPTPLLVLSVASTAFCHQMVRSLVAFMVDVGRGRVAVSTTPSVLAARDRAAARGAAPPHGLTLDAVGYPTDPLVPPQWLSGTSPSDREPPVH